ncbi:hypothetical protein [Streptomyces buecherae]|uniref:hypothetical protein n=1 Tax=Streptomyces buecherae TaxID=2763006 RepID=UPI003654AE5D
MDESSVRKMSPRRAAELLSKTPGEELSLQAWEGLREVCVSGMQDERLSADERIGWAAAGALVVDRMRDHSECADRRVAMASEARLRAYVITRFGREDDSSLRDLSLLIRRVVDAVGAESWVVADSADGWQRMTRHEMLELRRIKNLVTPFKSILPLLSPTDPLRDKIKEWVDIIPLLP